MVTSGTVHFRCPSLLPGAHQAPRCHRAVATKKISKVAFSFRGIRKKSGPSKAGLSVAGPPGLVRTAALTSARSRRSALEHQRMADIARPSFSQVKIEKPPRRGG